MGAVRLLLLPVVFVLCATTRLSAQLEQLVIRAQGSQVGFPDEDDPQKIITVFLGGVEMDQGNRKMRGDTLVLVLRRGGVNDTPGTANTGEVVVPGERLLEAFFDGNVSLQEDGELVVGAHSLYIDNVAGTLAIVDAEWRSNLKDAPLIVRYRTMRQLQGGVREMEGVSYTTCDFGHAHWQVDTPWARLLPTEDGRVLHTGGNTVRLGGLPVLWLPSLHFNLDREKPPLRRVGITKSKRFGTELVTEWGGDASQLMSDLTGQAVTGEWAFELSNYSKRGVLYRPEWTYATETSKGKLFGVYIRDRAAFDQLKVPIDDHSRGRIDLEHRTRIDENRVLDIEVSRISDDGFLKEYYEHEYRVGKQQETYISYRDVKNNRAISILGRTRLNDYETQVEYLPEVVHRVTGEAVDTGLLGDAYIGSRSYISNARLRDEPRATELDDSTRVLRVGTDVSLDWPIDIGDDKLLVSAGFGLTHFEHSKEFKSEDDPLTPNVNEEVARDGSAIMRYSLLGGVEWTRTYSGTTDTQSDLWNIDGIRQILEPAVGFRSVLELNHRPEDLRIIDDVEKLDKDQRFTVGLRHRIQTHQGKRVVTILDSEVSVPFFPNEDRDNDGTTTGLVTIDTRWKPGANIWGLRKSTLRWRGVVDAEEFQYVKSFVSFTTPIGPDERLSISNSRTARPEDHRTKPPDKNGSTNFLTFGLQKTLTPRWSVALFLQEDLKQGERSRQGILLRQQAHKWFIDLELSRRRGATDPDTGKQKDDEDTRIALRITPSFFDDDETLLSSLGRIR